MEIVWISGFHSLAFFFFSLATCFGSYQTNRKKECAVSSKKTGRVVTLSEYLLFAQHCARHLNILSLSVLGPTLRCENYCTHFSNKDIEIQRNYDLPKVTN